jgi:hypothetical protein
MAILTRARIAGAWVVLTAAALLPVPSNGQQPLTEAQLKSGFVYNAGIFVEWPPDAGSSTALVIGFPAGHDVAHPLAALTGKKINGRTISVKPFEPDDDPRDYQILFLGKVDRHLMSTVQERIGDAPVLTIGDTDGFTAQGGVVRLYMEDGRLRFEINMSRAERARLRVSARMLGLAKIVR